MVARMNLSNLNESSGTREAYWLMAVELAREKFQARLRTEVSRLPRGDSYVEEG